MNKLRIAYAPTRRFVFSKEDALKYKALIREKIESFNLDIEIIDLEGINEEGLLHERHEEAEIIKRFKDAEVDALFVPHCNFGTEDIVARVAKALDKPVLLWGPRDEAPLENGMRLRDTQCGLFATGKVLRRFGVKFTYITNCRVDNPVFERGFKNFIAAANVVKHFKNLRILQISTRPSDFWSVICNEGELLEKFGIQIHPISLEDLRKSVLRIEKIGGEVLEDEVNDLKIKVDWELMPEESMRKMAALKIAIRRMVEQTRSNAVAIQCWSALQSITGIMPCFVNALLTDEQIPVTCETDIHGAITSIMVQAATMNKKPTFFADITVRHPENPNGELLFHCGNFPLSMNVDKKPKLQRHFLFDDHAPGTLEGEVKGGDMTIARFDGDHGEYSIFLGKAKGIEGPYTRGAYVWVEVNDWPLWEEKLVKGPYIHHSTGVHEDVIPALYEACQYIPGLTPDPVDPTVAEIEAWLRGSDLNK